MMLELSLRTCIAVAIVLFVTTAPSASPFSFNFLGEEPRRISSAISSNSTGQSLLLSSSRFSNSLDTRKLSSFPKKTEEQLPLDSPLTREDVKTTQRTKFRDQPPLTQAGYSRTLRVGRQLTCVEIVRADTPDNRQIVRPCAVREAAF